MKLTDKRFWNGEKTVYYPSFKHALTDSILWSILGIGINASRKMLEKYKSLIIEYFEYKE